MDGFLGFYLGWHFDRQKIETEILSGGVSSLRQSTDYKLISPLLLCSPFDNKDFTEYKALEKKINDFIFSTRSDSTALIGVYFRDLVNGHWVGINENQKFSPASLLKVPIMIAYLKFAEKDPRFLSKIISYDGSFDINKIEYFHSDYWINPGSYKTEDLIKAMIVNSDNNATKLLSDNIDHDSLAEVFTDLQLPFPGTNAPESDFISPKSYSYFSGYSTTPHICPRSIPNALLKFWQPLTFHRVLALQFQREFPWRKNSANGAFLKIQEGLTNESYIIAVSFTIRNIPMCFA